MNTKPQNTGIVDAFMSAGTFIRGNKSKGKGCSLRPKHNPGIAVAGCDCPCCKDAFTAQEHELAKLQAENMRLQKPLIYVPDKVTAKQLRRIARRAIPAESAAVLSNSTRTTILRCKASV